MHITRVTVDCADPEAVAEFWNDALRWGGATIAWEEKFPPDVASHYRNVVLRDIEGNEFCLGAGALPETQESLVSDSGGP